MNIQGGQLPSEYTASGVYNVAAASGVDVSIDAESLNNDPSVASEGGRYSPESRGRGGPMKFRHEQLKQ